MSGVLALVCAVPLEAGPIQSELRDPEPLTIGRKPAVRGLLGQQRVILFPLGMGKTNAAQGLTALLESHPVQAVVSFGVAGAYAGSGIQTGGLALATREIYGDEGVAAPDGWLSTREIGIPLLELDGTKVFNTFELDGRLVAGAGSALEAAGIPASAGPFVTVSTCSGTLARGAEIAGRHGAVAESMEGAACAHVCALYGVPFLEVRGISNAVEDRDLSRWRLREAAQIAARAVTVLVARWSDLVADIA